ncbi:MAG: hypothetical protein NVSMB25_13130 [Thermoleophilaceae bacterium]
MQRQPKSGSGELPGLVELIGGPLGMAETAVPGAAFAVIYGFTNTDTAAVAAIGIAVILVVLRLLRRESPRHALSGLIGIGFAAFIAARSGQARNFFVPGLLANAGYSAAFLISLAVRRPLVGLIVSRLDGEGERWRSDPLRSSAFVRATWLWAGLFLLRLVVQLPLYLAGAVVVLGIARAAMGVPLFALGLWLTWLLVRGSRREAAEA